MRWARRLFIGAAPRGNRSVVNAIITPAIGARCGAWIGAFCRNRFHSASAILYFARLANLIGAIVRGSTVAAAYLAFDSIWGLRCVTVSVRLGMDLVCHARIARFRDRFSELVKGIPAAFFPRQFVSDRVARLSDTSLRSAAATNPYHLLLRWPES